MNEQVDAKAKNKQLFTFLGIVFWILGFISAISNLGYAIQAGTFLVFIGTALIVIIGGCFMNEIQKKRISIVLGVPGCVFFVLGIILYSLKQNLAPFFLSTGLLIGWAQFIIFRKILDRFIWVIFCFFLIMVWILFVTPISVVSNKNIKNKDLNVTETIDNNTAIIKIIVPEGYLFRGLSNRVRIIIYDVARKNKSLQKIEFNFYMKPKNADDSLMGRMGKITLDSKEYFNFLGWEMPTNLYIETKLYSILDLDYSRAPFLKWSATKYISSQEAYEMDVLTNKDFKRIFNDSRFYDEDKAIKEMELWGKAWENIQKEFETEVARNGFGESSRKRVISEGYMVHLIFQFMKNSDFDGFEPNVRGKVHDEYGHQLQLQALAMSSQISQTFNNKDEKNEKPFFLFQKIIDKKPNSDSQEASASKKDQTNNKQQSEFKPKTVTVFPPEMVGPTMPDWFPGYRNPNYNNTPAPKSTPILSDTAISELNREYMTNNLQLEDARKINVDEGINKQILFGLTFRNIGNNIIYGFKMDIVCESIDTQIRGMFPIESSTILTPDATRNIVMRFPNDATLKTQQFFNLSSSEIIFIPMLTEISFNRDTLLRLVDGKWETIPIEKPMYYKDNYFFFNPFK